MSTEQPSYYSILTAPVRYSTKISDKAKLLYAEITSLSTKHGYCWASNAYFANLYTCSIDTISRCIKQLETNGFIDVRIDAEDGNKRYIWLTESVAVSDKMPARPIRKNADTYPQKCGDPIRKNADNNNKENNKDNREDTPSLQAQQISPVPKSETPSEQQTKTTSVIPSVIPSVVSSVPTSVISSDLKEESAAGQRAGAAVSGAADSTAYHSQREAYRTDSELRTIMAAYYKGNPNEYTVGILNDAKGSRMTTEQLKDCMTMWASYMIENQKFNHSAHQLHQSFKRWVLRESEYKRTAQAGAKQGQPAHAETVTLKTKGFNFQ